MMRSRTGRLAAALAAGAWGLASAAQAADRPQLLPQRDAVVSYSVHSSARGAPTAARVSFQAGGNKLRVEPDNQPGYLLLDRGADRALLVLAGTNLAMQIGLNGGIDRYVLNSQASFQRLDQDRVAGLRCTVWRMRSPDAQGTGCVTADGLILRAEGTDRRGQHASIEAETVQYAPQPADTFEPPPGSRVLSFGGGAPLRLP